MSNDFSLDSVIRKIPDFPKPGILFYDITGILVNPEAFRYCIDSMVKMYKGAKLDAIAAVESRGFIFAGPLAEKLGIPASFEEDAKASTVAVKKHQTDNKPAVYTGSLYYIGELLKEFK